MAGKEPDPKNNDPNKPDAKATPPVRWVWLRIVQILAFAAFLLVLAFDHLDAKADKELISALLNWPFLFFVLLLFAGIFAGDRFLAMLEKRKWRFTKDGIIVEDMIAQGEGMEMEVKELRDRLVALEGGGEASAPVAPPSLTDLPKILAVKSVEEALVKLTVRRSGDGQFEVYEDGKGTSLSDLIKQSAEQGMTQKSQPLDELTTNLHEALSGSRFTWRSIERLALKCGVDQAEAYRALDARRDLFRIGKGKSGREIARLT